MGLSHRKIFLASDKGGATDREKTERGGRERQREAREGARETERS